jgi:Tol biopolymer transport system component
MTDVETQVRQLLQAVAERSRPVPLLDTFWEQRLRARRRRRVVLSAVAVATATAVAVVTMFGGNPYRTTAPEPALHPPKVFHVTGAQSATPGLVRMLVTLGSSHGEQESLGYVVPEASGDAVRFVPNGRGTAALSEERLMSDGRTLLELGGMAANGDVILNDLVTGRERRVPNPHGDYAEMSPDGSTVAVWAPEVTLIDIASKRSRQILHIGPGLVASNQLGWSPDGQKVAIKDKKGVAVVGLDGQLVIRWSDVSLVNGSQSWSPDGRSLLVYDTARSSYRLLSVDGGQGADLRTPPDAVRALGWTGERVVWLAGQPGAQRLITTDRAGAHPRVWTRFDVGSSAIESVTWSRALTG